VVLGDKNMVNSKKILYFDYQSAKPVDPKVIEAMMPYFHDQFGNPSSLHTVGDVATQTLEQNRARVAKLINAKPEEIIFTSGATESSNLALLGYAYRNMKKGNHIIMSEVEHISILNLAKALERTGFKVSFVPVDQYGQINVEKLQKRITPQTILISVQVANNEIGTIQPIHEIGEIAKEKNITFFTDAVAAEGLLPLDVRRDSISLMTLSSNDLYGPKGVGVLFKKENVALQPQIIGGGQENGLRSGSENMPGIVGMGIAAELIQNEMKTEIPRLAKFRDKFIKEVLEKVPRSYLNGHPSQRLANNAHFRFEAIEGESILLSFKDHGIAVSTGSACSSKTLEASHTLIATGLLHEEAHGSLELTSGRWTTEEEVNTVISVLPGIVDRLRKLSPLYKKPE
jgi:cysteine desulfurase